MENQENHDSISCSMMTQQCEIWNKEWNRQIFDSTMVTHPLNWRTFLDILFDFHRIFCHFFLTFTGLGRPFKLHPEKWLCHLRFSKARREFEWISTFLSCNQQGRHGRFLAGKDLTSTSLLPLPYSISQKFVSSTF